MSGVGSSSPSEAQEEMPPAKEEKHQDEGMETFMVPKSALYGKDIKAGDTKTIKAVKVYEDEIEFECAKEGSEMSPKEDMEEMMPDA